MTSSVRSLRMRCWPAAETGSSPSACAAGLRAGPCQFRVNMSRHGSAMECPVYLKQRTCLVTAGMAVECQFWTHAPQRTTLGRHLTKSALCQVDDKLGYEPDGNLSVYLDGDWIFAPSRASMRPRILTLNDFAPSTNSTRTIRDGVGTIRVLDGPGNRIALSKAGPV